METTSGPIVLPALPVPHADWIQYASQNSDKPIRELIEPFKEYDSKLREVFAQQPDHPAITQGNVVEIFKGNEHNLKIRARDLGAESEEESQRYIMPLSKTDRKPDGSPAIVQSIKEFQTNFQLFSESSLVDMDWSNVVVAGSAVVTALLPAGKHGSSKRALREYYHQKVAPASDVDLFLYGLTEEQAVEKIKQIEQKIKDSILTETTTIRTKNAITIASQYPTRHVQIVLRIYRSISEILTGFDVDCSCAAFDGRQVYASPRAVAAYMTQVNTVDLTRRSPSYENRLSKYSKRGFEIYFPLLDRSRVDPTLFERSFGRTLGLARLLVLEKLPKNADREAYVDQRRAERGRPAINRWASRKLRGNMKDDNDDEVAEWVVTDDVSDYHTFTIPYGPKYNARKIERLLYAKDLLLNAEWNRPKDRESTLHRHPAFFGNAVDVVGDCCGYCPKPLTSEDEELAEEESKTYVSGNLTFIKDDPGRQAIGSFHPLTDDDWTEMAYVGNTARLCQAIVDHDLETVQDWLKQEGADPDRRDHTGRMPLHLAVCSSSLEIVQALIDGGARITPRIFDGKTALHLAAMHGEAHMVKAILTKSEANEEEEAKKEDARKAARKAGKAETTSIEKTESDQRDIEMKSNESEHSSDDDIDMLDDDSDDQDATTDASIIRIDHRKPGAEHENLPVDNNEDEPDVYDINVLAWDAPVSALHLAIANGHTDVVKVLVEDFGADILLPIKLVNDYNKSPRAAILPLVLALQLESGKAQAMTTTLIGLGASPAQADISHATALHYFSVHGIDLLKTMIVADRPAAERAVAHLKMNEYQYSPDPKSALQMAIEHTDVEAVDALLDLGAKPAIDYDTYLKSYKSKFDVSGAYQSNEQQFRQNFLQPIFTTINAELPAVALRLVDAGADVNSLNTEACRTVDSPHPNVYGNNQRSVLDAVRDKVKDLTRFLETGAVNNNQYSGAMFTKVHEPLPLKNADAYTEGLQAGSYAHWTTLKQLRTAETKYQRDLENHNRYRDSVKEPEGTQEKKAAAASLLEEFKTLESQLVSREAKTFKELYPAITIQDQQHHQYKPYEPAPPIPWSPILSFQLSDLTEVRRLAYLKLYQACWDGELPTIKELTLAVWGEQQSPLKIAVQDSNSFSPFSIAVLRRHMDVAKAILEIAQAQYAPEEKKGQPKHSLQEYDSDDESTGDRNEHFYIFAEIIDDRFTIENIGEAQSQVKSNITPLQMMSWPCPISQFFEDGDITAVPPQGNTFNSALWGNQRYSRYRARSRRNPRKLMKDAANGRTYHVDTPPEQESIPDVEKPGNLIQLAIFLDDLDLLRYLITLGDEYTRRVSADDNIKSKFFRVSEADFLYAMRLGHLQVLEEIIKHTGAGIPLDDLVKRSGVEVPEPEKPKSYQGLSVHGKKRADWANAGRDIEIGEAQEQHPPLLHAARLASMRSVEWFLGDAPARCYTEFAETHSNDARIQNLAKSKGGIEGTINKWLGLRSHLIIHTIVLGKTTEESLDLLRYICKVRPDAVHHKSASGLTPLQLAFSLYRTEMIKILLENGADQTCRNGAGDNIVHSLLNKQFIDNEDKLPRTRELLQLIDERLLPSLFLERTTTQPGAATPLATFMYDFVKANNSYHTNQETPEYVLKYLTLILEFSKGEDLGVVNSEGDTPLHVAIRYGSPACLRIMLDCRPDLLWRENATGRTPYEVAEDGYLMKEVFSDPPSLDPPSAQPHYHSSCRVSRFNRRGRYTNSILQREPKTFVEEPKDEKSDAVKAWEVCREFADKSGGRKRKLVSLVEANEVAKRLAVKKRIADKMENDEKSDAGKNEEETKGDEVAVWYNMGLWADK